MEFPTDYAGQAELETIGWRVADRLIVDISTFHQIVKSLSPTMRDALLYFAQRERGQDGSLRTPTSNTLAALVTRGLITPGSRAHKLTYLGYEALREMYVWADDDGAAHFIALPTAPRGKAVTPYLLRDLRTREIATAEREAYAQEQQPYGTDHDDDGHSFIVDTRNGHRVSELFEGWTTADDVLKQWTMPLTPATFLAFGDETEWAELGTVEPGNFVPEFTGSDDRSVVRSNTGGSVTIVLDLAVDKFMNALRAIAASFVPVGQRVHCHLNQRVGYVVANDGGRFASVQWRPGEQSYPVDTFDLRPLPPVRGRRRRSVAA